MALLLAHRRIGLLAEPVDWSRIRELVVEAFAAVQRSPEYEWLAERRSGRR